MTITRTDAETTARLKAIFPAWSFGRSSLDGAIWVQRFPGVTGWIPLLHAVDERWQRAIADARETADPEEPPLSDEDAVERALDMLIEEGSHQ